MSSSIGPKVASDSLLVYYDPNTVSTANISTNLFSKPEDISDASYWFTNGATVQANAAIAPDGTLTADKVIGNYGVSTRKSVYQPVANLKAGCRYTFSVYLKSAGYATASMWHDNNPYSQPAAYQGANSLLDLTTGTSSDTTYTTMTSVGNGWYRCQVTAVYPYSDGYTYSIAVGAPNGGVGTPDGDGINGIYVWGAKLELTATVFPLPALELNFNRSLAVGSLVTFTRTTVGTYYNSSGRLVSAAINTPRFDYDSSTLTAKGLLIETASTNSYSGSSGVPSAFGFNDGTTTFNTAAVTAPDGTATARLFSLGTITAGVHYHLNAITWTNNNTNVLSAYFKAGTGTIYPTLVMDQGSSGGVWAKFDLSGNGAAVGNGGGVNPGTIQGYGIEKCPNGWFRCWVAGYVVGPGTNGRFSISCSNSPLVSVGPDGYQSYAGTIGDSFYVWGIQIEKDVGFKKPTSYIYSGSRGVDDASITGTNFSSWFNQYGGTLLIEFYKTKETNYGYYAHPMNISDGTSNNEYYIFGASGASYVTSGVQTGGTNQQDSYLTATANTGINKLAFSYKANQLTHAANGTFLYTDTSVTLPTVNQLRIGGDASNGANLNDCISRIVYWTDTIDPTKVANLTNQWSSGVTTSGVSPSTYYPVSSATANNTLLDQSGNNAIGVATGTYGYDYTAYNVPVFTLNNNATSYDGRIALYAQDMDLLAKTYNFTVMFAARKRFYGLQGNNNGVSEIFQGVNNGYNMGWRISENNQGTPGLPFSGKHNWSLGFNDINTSIGVSDTNGAGNRMCICAFTVSPTTLTAFVNGNFATTTNPKTYVSGTSLPIISWTGAGAGSFNGDIGFFMIYNRALSQAEITQTFNSMRTRYGI